MVEYHPISAKDEARLHQIGEKAPSGHLRCQCDARREESGEELWEGNMSFCATRDSATNAMCTHVMLAVFL